MKITFDVMNQKICRTDNNKVVAGSKNYLHAAFFFKTDDWDDITKTAVFQKGDKPYNVILDEENTCLVPWEVIKCGKVHVSVFGGDLITTDSTEVKIFESGYVEGETPAEPTPDVYTQLINKLDSLQTGSVDKDTIKDAVNEYMEENPADIITDEEIAGILSAYLEENGISGGSTKTEISETGIIGLYDTHEFVGDTFVIAPASEAFVASRNFLHFKSAGRVENTTPLVEGETIAFDGVEITLNEDGSVTLNGKAMSSFYVYTNITDEFRTNIIGKKAKISLHKSDTTTLTFSSGLAFNDASYGYNLTQTGSYSGLVTAEMLSGCSRLEVRADITYNNLTVSAMLELENDKGYLGEYEKSDCELITASTVYAITDYPFIGIVGEHTIKYYAQGGNDSASAAEIVAVKRANPLYDKKIVCLGDSLCYGQGFDGGYCTVLSELEPDTTFINKGVGGSQISSNHESGGNWWIQNQLSGVSEDTDYVVCEGYVNDYLTNCPLGSISDGYVAELDTATFYGGMESLCKKLASEYTDKRYGFIIAHSYYSADSAYENHLYIEAIKKCCDKWGIPYLDLSTIITPLVPVYKNTYYTDGLHYNEAGYRRIAPAIREWIKTI